MQIQNNKYVELEIIYHFLTAIKLKQIIDSQKQICMYNFYVGVFYYQLGTLVINCRNILINYH